LSNNSVDISVVGEILLSEFDKLNASKFKLAVIYSLLNGKSARIYGLNGRISRLFKNKKGHTALFKLKIDEAINSLIADRILLRFGTANNSLKLCDNHVDIFNKLKLNLNNEGNMGTGEKKEINIVDSFAKNKADYFPKDNISNADEIIWFLKSILIHIRQRAGNSNCKDCNYFAYLAEHCFDYIDPAQLNTHVDYDDKRFEYLAIRLKELQHEAADEAICKHANAEPHDLRVQ
jgi:hypothetical protein